MTKGPEALTLTPQEQKFLREFVTSANEDEFQDFLKTLSPNALAAMPWLFELWSLDHQRPPEGNWRNWLLLGGRGAGKTRAGSEWIRTLVEGSTTQNKGQYRRIALIADTLDQAREVMVFGESGILACSPPDRRPTWSSTRKMLEWPNGARAQIFSGSDPESLRGPQFDAAWLDEFGKWKKAQETWEMLQFGLRLGENPRVLITTTPRTLSILNKLLSDQSTVTTHAPTSANRHNLAPGFIEALESQYSGTRLGRQEMDGEFITDIEGALFSFENLEKSRSDPPENFDRIVVAVDPPASHHDKSDECGIMVVGATYGNDPKHWKAYLLEDLSIAKARPEEWAKRAITAYREFGADCILAEVNQGGNMVESIIRQVDPLVAFKSVRAKSSKTIRAEPISALYDQGRVRHCKVFEKLEEQMILMSSTGYMGTGSPDRVDALVWALTELLITPNKSRNANPQIRNL